MKVSLSTLLVAMGVRGGAYAQDEKPLKVCESVSDLARGDCKPPPPPKPDNGVAATVACTGIADIFTDRALFDAATTTVLEDFANPLSPPIVPCGDTSTSSAGGGCYAPGELQPGFTIQTVQPSGRVLAIVQSTSGDIAIGAFFSNDAAELVFLPGITAVGFDSFEFFGNAGYDIAFFDLDDNEICTQTVPANSGENFVGILASVNIGRVLFDSGGGDSIVIFNLAFGTSASEPPSSAPTNEDCSDTRSTCPADFGKSRKTGFLNSKSGKGLDRKLRYHGKGKSSKGKSGKGKSGQEEEEETIPVCVVTSGKGKSSNVEYNTQCIDRFALVDFEPPSKGKGRFVGVSCGCCDPIDEGEDYPFFCGGQICAGEESPCVIDDTPSQSPSESAAPSSYKGKSGSGKGSKGKSGSGKSSKGKNGSGKGSKGKSSVRVGVEICVNEGETLCVDQLDPVYLAPPRDYSCGMCSAAPS